MIFSDFVTSKLEELLQHGSSNEDKIDFSRCLSGEMKQRLACRAQETLYFLALFVNRTLLQDFQIKFVR